MCKSKITGEISAGGVTVNIVVWNISVNNLHLHYITGSDNLQSVLCPSKWIKIAYLRSGESSGWGSTTDHAFWCCTVQAALPLPSVVEIIWFVIRRVQWHHITMHSDLSCKSSDQCVRALSCRSHPYFSLSPSWQWNVKISVRFSFPSYYLLLFLWIIYLIL